MRVPSLQAERRDHPSLLNAGQVWSCSVVSHNNSQCAGPVDLDIDHPDIHPKLHGDSLRLLEDQPFEPSPYILIRSLPVKVIRPAELYPAFQLERVQYRESRLPSTSYSDE